MIWLFRLLFELIADFELPSPKIKKTIFASIFKIIYKAMVLLVLALFAVLIDALSKPVALECYAFSEHDLELPWPGQVDHLQTPGAERVRLSVVEPILLRTLLLEMFALNKLLRLPLEM